MQASIDGLKAAAAATGNEAHVTATALYGEAMEIQYALLRTMASFRKPKDLAFCLGGCKLGQFGDQVEQLGRKDRKSDRDMMKVLQDGFQIFFWHASPGSDMLKEFLDEIVSQVLFYGNKVRKSGTPQNQAWFEAFNKMFETFKAFIEERRETITTWTGKQDATGAPAFFEQQQSGAAPTQTPAQEEKKETPTPAKPAPAAKPAAKKVAPPKKEF